MWDSIRHCSTFCIDTPPYIPPRAQPEGGEGPPTPHIRLSVTRPRDSGAWFWSTPDRYSSVMERCVALCARLEPTHCQPKEVQTPKTSQKPAVVHRFYNDSMMASRCNFRRLWDAKVIPTWTTGSSSCSRMRPNALKIRLKRPISES